MQHVAAVLSARPLWADDSVRMLLQRAARHHLLSPVHMHCGPHLAHHTPLPPLWDLPATASHSRATPPLGQSFARLVALMPWALPAAMGHSDYAQRLLRLCFASAYAATHLQPFTRKAGHHTRRTAVRMSCTRTSVAIVGEQISLCTPPMQPETSHPGCCACPACMCWLCCITRAWLHATLSLDSCEPCTLMCFV